MSTAEPAMTPEAFQQLVIDVARRQPDVVRAEPHPEHDFAVSVTTTGGRADQVVFLDNWWGHLAPLARGAGEEAVEQLFREHRARRPMPTSWEEARDIAFLALRAGHYGVELLDRFEPVFEPALDDLGSFMTFDLGTVFANARVSQLEQWGVSREEAWSAARENTLRLAASPEPARSGAFSCFRSGRIDAASYLLAPGWLSSVAAGRDVVAWVPERDTLAVFVTDGAISYRDFAMMAAQEWKGATRRISPCLYTLDGDRVVPLRLPADHPDHEDVERSRYELRHTQYALQKQVLDAHYAQQGVDRFVAPYMVVDHSKRGRYSVTAWPAHCDMLLPHVDVVAMTGERDELIEIPFEAMLQATDLAPTPHRLRRYHVDRWPERSILAALHPALASPR